MLTFRRALVTGGAGFIGSHIVDRLIREGCQVTVLDDLSTGNLRNLQGSRSSRLKIVRGDVRNVKLVRDSLQNIEVVFHEAAIVSVQRSIQEPETTQRVNVDGTVNLLKAAADAGVRRFIFASSAAVYGRAKVLPIAETAVPAPISPYGSGKLAAEEHCLEFHRKTELLTTILRYFNVFGPGASSGDYSGVITKFAQKLAKGEQPVIYGRGNQTRDFIYVDDVVKANILAASSTKAEGEIFNVGGGQRVTVNELASLEGRLLFTSKAALPPDYQPAKSGDIEKSYADISKIRRILGFEPEFSLRNGLELYLKWFTSKPKQSHN